MKRETRWVEGEGNIWKAWGGEEHLEVEPSKQQKSRHSHDRWALPVRRYVAVTRCPLGPVGWHSNWVCSNWGVLWRCQQSPYAFKKKTINDKNQILHFKPILKIYHTHHKLQHPNDDGSPENTPFHIKVLFQTQTSYLHRRNNS